MKKMLLVVLTVLAMATVANAALTAKISVNGVVDPPDTSIRLLPSQEVIIDIHAWNDVSAAVSIALLQGPATLTKGANFWAWEQSNWYEMPAAEKPDYIAAFTDMGYLDITNIYYGDIVDASDPFTTPNGRVFDGLVFHCEGLGEAVLTLFDPDLGVLDSQQIHQIPEPLTFALLGLGGLFLRRRK